jgi:hypothetical protein
LRQPQQLGRPHRPRHAVQLGDLFGRAIKSRAAILDVIVTLDDLAIVDCGAGIERVVAQLLEDQLTKLARRNASALLQAINRAEERPVRSFGHAQRIKGFVDHF